MTNWVQMFTIHMLGYPKQKASPKLGRVLEIRLVLTREIHPSAFKFRSVAELRFTVRKN